MSEDGVIGKLKTAIENEEICKNCPTAERISSKNLLGAMALGFSYGIEVGRPQGEWKPKNHHTDYCSECGFEETQWRTTEYKFCPNCGCWMKGADNETD